MVERRWTVRSSDDLGRTIADLRRARGLSQRDLAEGSGVERTYLAKLEAGATTLFVDRALRLLRRLGATVTITAEIDASPEPAAGSAGPRR